MEIIKKLLQSRLLRFLLSAILIYLAFKRVNISEIIIELQQVPFWFIGGSLTYFILMTALGSYRWNLLLLKKPKIKDIIEFTKAAYIGAFSGLLFPTQIAADAIKWIPLQKKYPKLTRAQLISSAFVDRIIGFSAFIFVATIAALLGRLTNVSYPDYLFWLFLGLFIGVLAFYVLIYNFPVEKLLAEIPLINNLNHLINLIRQQSAKRIALCLFIAFLTEIAWITPIWFNSLIFNAQMSLVSIYIFMPIIALILVLPISIAGFGAREQLFLFFFSQVGVPNDRILLVSALTSIISVLNNLMGGLLLLF